MEPECGLALSARKVEYIKFIFETGGTVRTTMIATAFSVDPSTITKTLAELAAGGYIRHVPYHGVCLTETGERHAEFLIKRHRILSLMLVRNGLLPEEACREASQFESLVSKKAVDRICHFMGHPRQGICGEITHDNDCLEREEGASS
ncbi:MAG: metal-dependent transcriptional regulator [Methanoregula sp.]|jgi:Mn-dependent DtxR family transcriptional regulator|nr:metal-dependent transcriptional regulator [Methanoregula sp.]